MGQTPPTRRGARVAAAVASGAVLVTSVVGFAGVNAFSAQVSRVDAGTSGASVSSGPVNLLVVASDDRAGLSTTDKVRLHLGKANYGAHTDTMMLVHLSGDGTSVTAVSLPRDTLAAIPAWTDPNGARHASRKAKLNAAFSLGGPKLMVSTVEAMTGVRIDHYAELNFAGFLGMVDALGGVEVCLTNATTDKNSGLNLPAGRQTVNGAQALAYVRARYIDPSADIGRMKRQQKFVGAIAKKALSTGTLTDPAKVAAFVSAVAHSLKTDTGLGTSQMLDLADRFKGIDPSSIAMLTVPLGPSFRDGGLGSVITWDAKKSIALFSAIRNDQPIVAPVAPTTVRVAPGGIHVRVLNGTTTAGLGATAAHDLAAVGFAVAGPAGNAATQVGPVTVIRFDPRYADAATTVKAALRGATLTPVPGFGRTFEVTIGTSYAGATKVKVASAKSPAAPRTASDDICR
jgi:LCP family protein required for cell wall assembly